jgi:hypothetical protein
VISLSSAPQIAAQSLLSRITTDEASVLALRRQHLRVRSVAPIAPLHCASSGGAVTVDTPCGIASAGASCSGAASGPSSCSSSSSLDVAMPARAASNSRASALMLDARPSVLV